jgi:hypothetical protein
MDVKVISQKNEQRCHIIEGRDYYIDGFVESDFYI